VRRARLFDGIDATGEPYFAPAHPRIDDEDERARIARFLAGGTVISRVSGLDVDRLDPSRPHVVPLNTRTDGTWIWSGGIRYYLRRYGIAPEPEFLRHMAAHEYVAPEADRAAVHAALAVLRSRR
jgi:hypothetical protein